MTDTYTPLKPNEEQKARMDALRDGAHIFGNLLDKLLPSGPDKTHAIRTFRTAMMWANYTIMRQPDGSPRVRENNQTSG